METDEQYITNLVQRREYRRVNKWGMDWNECQRACNRLKSLNKRQHPTAQDIINDLNKQEVK